MASPIRPHLTYTMITGAVALACGIFITIVVGPKILYLIAAGCFFVLFYTWPLKYIGLGELSVVLVWGPLMVGGTYFAVSGGHWSWDAVWIGFVYALGPTTVLFGKHIDKIEEDRIKKVRTLPVVIGEKAARFATVGLWLIQYGLIIALLAVGKAGYPLALVVFAVPWMVRGAKVFSRPRPKSPSADLPSNVWPLYLSAQAFVYNRVFGGFFLLGLIADTVFHRLGMY